MKIGDIVKVKQSAAVGVVVSSIVVDESIGALIRVRLAHSFSPHLFQVRDLEQL